MAFCVPCVQYGENAHKIDGSNCFCACCAYAVCLWFGCACLLAAGKRTTMRYNYGLQEDCCCDCCVHWCCPCCALSQEARELDMRGPPPPRNTMQSPTVVVNTINTPPPQQIVPGSVMMSPMGMSTPYAVGANGMAYHVGPNGQPYMMASPHMMQQQGYPMMTPGSPHSPGQPPQYGTPVHTAVGGEMPTSQYPTSQYPPSQYPTPSTEGEQNHTYSQ